MKSRSAMVISVVSSLAASLSASVAGGTAVSASTNPTPIAVNGNGDTLGDAPYMGIGAVLGGGGNARYLMDYPSAERTQILDYLFKPGYGANLQILKLEIGGGANSTDGAEPSVMPTNTTPNCLAGYEFAIAQQAVQLNPNLILYGLQWAAPSWVSGGISPPSVFTGDPSNGFDPTKPTFDLKYLINWLNCAKNTWGLHISYLGGWNENDGSDTGKASSSTWYDDLHAALAANGYGQLNPDGTVNPWYVQLIAGDLNPAWEYAAPGNPYPNINVLGAHDICGYPNEDLGSSGPPKCEPAETGEESYKQSDDATEDAGDGASEPTTGTAQPLWASELGGMDSGAQKATDPLAPGDCTDPCAPAMDRSLVRGYPEAGLTGYLEWPALDAMPQTGGIEANTPLPYENRGLITADQPWGKGYFTVNAMTWAIAQFTQFVSAPTPGSVWTYEKSASGYLQNDATGKSGAYVTLIHNVGSGADGWTTVVDTTTATAPQDVTFTISGGASLANKTVYEWSSDFNFGDTGQNGTTPVDTPAYWLAPQGTPQISNGSFTVKGLLPGSVYTFSTTPVDAASLGPRTLTGMSPVQFPTQYYDPLSSASAGAGFDDEPQYLAAQDGSFEVVSCPITPPNTQSGQPQCAEQMATGTTGTPPVFWQSGNSLGVRYPYAIIGDGSLNDYTVSADVALTQPGTSAGLLGRFTNRFVKADEKTACPDLDIGYFDGYVFDISTSGAWQLVRNSAGDTNSYACGATAIKSGTLPFTVATNAWYKLTLNFNGNTINLSVTDLAHSQTWQFSYTNTLAWSSGLAGIEAGYTNQETYNWPQVLYSNLCIYAVGQSPPQGC